MNQISSLFLVLTESGSCAGAVTITAFLSFTGAFLLGALTASLLIFLWYIPRKFKAPQTKSKTGSSVTTSSALPPGQAGKESSAAKIGGVVVKGNEAYGCAAEKSEMERSAAIVEEKHLMELKGNVAYSHAPHKEKIYSQDNSEYEHID